MDNSTQRTTRKEKALEWDRRRPDSLLSEEMIEFYVMSKAYNRYGGHTTLSPIGDFLLQGAPHFGDAIKEITVTLHFPNSGPPRKSLESLYKDHDLHRASLPKVVFRRASGKISMDVSSELLNSSNWERSSRLSLPLFGSGVDEIISALSLMRKRLKKSDDFNLDGFLAHCEAARKRVPNCEDELQMVAAELKAADEAKRAAMSPWEKLGIDWEDYHHDARDILDDPFFWDCTNEFAPNGNDTGADLLSAYSDWIKRHRDGQTMKFLESIARQWGYGNFAGMDQDVSDEAAIALAFADLKLRAICDPEARDLALRAIERQRTEALDSTGWSHRDERLKTLDVLEAKLDMCSQ